MASDIPNLKTKSMRIIRYMNSVGRAAVSRDRLVKAVGMRFHDVCRTIEYLESQDFVERIETLTGQLYRVKKKVDKNEPRDKPENSGDFNEGSTQ